MNPFRRRYTVLTPAAGRYVSGEWVAGEYSSSVAWFSVQAVKNTEQVEALPEGRRIDDYRRLYSDTRLQITGDGEGLQPAVVVIDGFHYAVTHREPWQNGIIPHFKYYVVRKYDG